MVENSQRLPLLVLDCTFVIKTAGGHAQHPSIIGADGMSFLCPKCYGENGGPEGTHRVLCWFEGRVADDVKPGPGRWRPQGTSVADVSFVPSAKTAATSVRTIGGCEWHGHIVRGHATV